MKPRRRFDDIWLARGFAARCLWPLAVLYGVVVRLRCAAYRAGRLAVAECPLPVVVVGNLVAGGAGKTPTVLALVALLRDAGWTPGIVSRGHGRAELDDVIEVQRDTTAAVAGDEPLLLHRRSGAPVVVGRDRVAAVHALHRRHAEVDIVVSDDGLQHRRMPRVLQVLVFDERGIGNGWLLPAGPLREPFAAAAPPPRSVVLYNAPRATTPWPGAVVGRRIAGAVPLAQWWHGAPATADGLQAVRRSADHLIAAAGVARPGRFFDALSAAGLVFEPLALADHVAFDVLPWPRTGATILVTEKDAVKLAPDRDGNGGVWVVPLDFDLPAAFAHDVLERLAALPNRPTTA